MATTVRTAARKPQAKGVPMSSTRKIAFVAGVFYLITFISIPTLALYGPVKNHRDWILSSGSHTGVAVGALLEVIVALAGIGTAVTLYPVVKRQNEGARAGLCRRPRPGSRHDLHRRRQPAVAGDLAAGPGRSGRSKRGRARHHRRVARRGLQLDVPALTEPHAGLQRTAAGLLDVPLPPRAPHHSRGRAHRRPVPHLHRHRNAVRRLQAGLPPARRSPGGCLGAVAGRVAGRQGLQAFPDHRRNGRRASTPRAYQDVAA